MSWQHRSELGPCINGGVGVKGEGEAAAPGQGRDQGGVPEYSGTAYKLTAAQIFNKFRELGRTITGNFLRVHAILGLW